MYSVGTTDELEQELQAFENKVMQMEQTLVKVRIALFIVGYVWFTKYFHG